MESLIILLPVTLVMIALATVVLLWAVDDGQFDDLDGPAHNILFDEPLRTETTATTDTQNKNNNNG